MSHSSLIDHFFRTQYGRVVSHLTHQFGIEHVDLAEDCVQESLFTAMQVWSYGKTPENPAGWILRVARNKMIDHLRREQKLTREQVPDSKMSEHLPELHAFLDNDMIRMLFACTNPAIKQESQLILTLKILCGFSIREIASSLLKKEQTIAKAYTRAKTTFKELSIGIQLPDVHQLEGRLNDVLSILYLLFNEGYKATEGDQIIREELCLEAIQLLKILLKDEIFQTSEAHALLALMLLHTSRFPARTDVEGLPVSLKDQDRTRWDQYLIQEGTSHLERAAAFERPNTYLFQAALSAEHCKATKWENTDWKAILFLYDRQLDLSPTPIVLLNRVIVLEKIYGADFALSALEKLEDLPYFERYYLYYATKADFLEKLEEFEAAIENLNLAIECCGNSAEKKYFEAKKAGMRH